MPDRLQISDQVTQAQTEERIETDACCNSIGGGVRAARNEPQAIRADVQTYYGRVAEQQLDVCGQSDCCGSELYVGEDLSELPSAAVNSSRGCGNPHVIASLQPGEVVLDLGSGGGLDVLLAARQVGEDGFVYGVDMTDRMLELARTNAARMGTENVEFRKGDLEDLPLGANTVDVIISNCVVNLTPDKGRALGEAFRVLKPGGRLAISDIVIDGDLSDLPESEAQIRAGLSWAGCIAGALTVSDLSHLLEAAGFEKVSIDVEQGYDSSDFFGELPPALSNLAEDVLDDLIGRFASSSIGAWKPGG